MKGWGWSHPDPHPECAPTALVSAGLVTNEQKMKEMKESSLGAMG